ncbi:uncharacterized protein LOC132715277 [Ruditapes philippinarum]|uniref:uncharacterized protein LOC132715277 n=1 Tax=Ruditapes philippinarum TaxID=129788 RepID=UPI00295A5F6D|nr:uncharacterized protein LOC132715277 [Ruditapes philippinarum]
MGSGMCKETKSFVSCILGEQNFATGDFLLTNASSNSYTCKASFLVSLYSLVLAQDESSSKMYDTDNQLKPFFIRCLLFPRCISSCFIPGFPCYATENKAEGTQSLYNCYMGVCQCGHRILSEDSVSSITCGICSRTIICMATPAKSNLTVLLSQGQNLNLDDIHVSKLINPVTSHILQLLLKGCFLGSVALGFTSKNLLEDILNVPEIDIVDTLSRGVDTHWNVIKDLLNVDDNGILAFLHTVFLKTGNHLFDTNCNFSNMEATLKWERTFDIMLMSILDTHCVNVRILYQRHNRIHNGENRSITMCLLESDDISNLTAESKLICSPVMYRIRACPSKSNFIYELHNVQDKFPLIDAVIEQEEKLELPKHILNLIQWHAATVANASYMLRRHDCSTMTVQDFIYFKQDTMKKDVIKQRFEAFRKSWEYLMLKLKDDNSFEQMKRIHSESKINECLMLSKNSLPFKILQKLIGIQNAFLDKILLLSRTCSALKVLRKEKIYALPCVKVTELKKEHLVHSDIDWDNLLQQESHSNLNYGCGRQINYDFYSIEEAIALEMIFGKCYIILENTLPEIVFIDELHKNYGNLIRELRKSVPQRPLTSDISNGIKSRKAEDPRMSTELLSHLGIVMTLLKKTSGDSDIPLVEYVDKWKYILCRDFPKKLLPSPESSMKLGHVVALSELLEELCADSVKEGLDDVYPDKLDGPLHDHIMLQLKDNLLSSLLFKALKRFTYRCLTSRIADPKQSLRLYLSDDSFWPMDIFQDNTLLIDGQQLNITEVLPDGLMVRHIFECFELMEAEMERKKQGQLKMSGFATSFQAKAKMSAPSKKEQKKKRTTNIRKF